MIFGKGDLLVLPAMEPRKNLLGFSFAYTNPSYDVCYTKYGFVVPLTFLGIPFDRFVEKRLPQIGNVPQHNYNAQYLMVNHDGDVYNCMPVWHDDNRGELVSIVYTYLHRELDGWWLETSRDLLTEGEMQFLGFLKTNPDELKIRDYAHKFHLGLDLHFLHIPDIVAKLHELFPQPESNEKAVDDLMKRFNQALENSKDKDEEDDGGAVIAD